MKNDLAKHLLIQFVKLDRGLEVSTARKAIESHGYRIRVEKNVIELVISGLNSYLIDSRILQTVESSLK